MLQYDIYIFINKTYIDCNNIYFNNRNYAIIFNFRANTLNVETRVLFIFFNYKEFRFVVKNYNSKFDLIQNYKFVIKSLQLNVINYFNFFET